MPRRIGPRTLSPSRVNFSHIDSKLAEQLLAKYKKTLQIIASKYARVGTADLDDLLAVGKVAILEAKVTYQEDQGCSLDTWTRKVIRWRMVEEASRFIERPLGNPEAAERLLNGHSPGDQYDRAFAKEAIGILDPREAVILNQRLLGYTLEEIASQLGVCHQVVARCEKRALKQLAEWSESGD